MMEEVRALAEYAMPSELHLVGKTLTAAGVLFTVLLALFAAPCVFFGQQCTCKTQRVVDQTVWTIKWFVSCTLVTSARAPSLLSLQYVCLNLNKDGITRSPS